MISANQPGDSTSYYGDVASLYRTIIDSFTALDVCGDSVPYHPEVDNWTNSVAGAKNIRAIMWHYLDTPTDNHSSTYPDTVDVTLEDMMDAYIHWYNAVGTTNRKRNEYSDSVVMGSSCRHHDDCTTSPFAVCFGDGVSQVVGVFENLQDNECNGNDCSCNNDADCTGNPTPGLCHDNDRCVEAGRCHTGDVHGNNMRDFAHHLAAVTSGMSETDGWKTMRGAICGGRADDSFPLTGGLRLPRFDGQS